MQNPTDDAHSPLNGLPAAPGRFLRLKAAAVVATIGLGLAGCASLRGPVTRSTSTLTCRQPVMSPVPETPARQTHGDIAMLLAIETPQCARSVEISWVEASGGFLTRLTSLGRPFRVRRTERDVFGIDDGTGMEAIVTITNQSERVFRGEDAVWAASVDGAVIPSEVGGMVGAVVPPGRDVEIRIPSIRVEATGGTYVFSLFDVPVRRNAAGETTEVGNFEWIYTLDHESVQVPAAETTCEFNMAGGEFSEFATSLGMLPGTRFQRGAQLGDTKVMTPQELEGDRWRC